MVMVLWLALARCTETGLISQCRGLCPTSSISALRANVRSTLTDLCVCEFTLVVQCSLVVMMNGGCFFVGQQAAFCCLGQVCGVRTTGEASQLVFVLLILFFIRVTCSGTQGHHLTLGLDGLADTL